MQLLEARRLFASIGGTVFNDLDADGVQGAGEVGQAGVIVFLDQNQNSVIDPGPTSTFTAAVPLPIPTVGTVSQTQAVSGLTGGIFDLNLTLNLTHTWDEDLDIFLVYR
jgi:hypothetical protein